jgi:hypothetical protein
MSCSRLEKGIRMHLLLLIDKRHVMTRDTIIERTLKVINQLPVDKAEEIWEFADFLLKRYEEQELTSGIQRLATEAKTFEFLENEEELYSVEDLKEVYHGKG